MHVGAQSYEVAVLILFYFEQCWCENKSSPVGKRALVLASSLAVAQRVEQVVHQSEGRWFDPRLLRVTCRCVLEQDT